MPTTGYTRAGQLHLHDHRQRRRHRVGQCFARGDSASTGRQQRQRLCRDREYRAVDSCFGAARQRHRSQRSCRCRSRASATRATARSPTTRARRPSPSCRPATTLGRPASPTRSPTGRARLGQRRPHRELPGDRAEPVQPQRSRRPLTANDPNSVELGVKFQASSQRHDHGHPFLQEPLDTGTHVADLWSANGHLACDRDLHQ